MAEKTKKTGKKGWLKWLGLVLAVIPLAWIYWRLDFHSMIAMLPRVAWWTGPMLLASVTAGIVLQALRWWILLHAFLPDLSFRRALAYHFMAVLYGTALPTGAAQDVIKTLIVASKNDMSVSWASFWLTRTLGLPALALLSLYGFVTMDRSTLPHGWEWALALFYFLIFVLFLVSFSKRVTRPVRLFLLRFIARKWLEPAERIRESVYCYRAKKKEVALSFAVTALTQSLLIVASCGAIYGITKTFPLWQCFTFIPIIELISVSFPFTPSGMGVRETLSAGLFAYLHLSKEQLGIYVMFLLFFSMLPRLLGLVPVIHGYAKGRRPEAAEALEGAKE